MYSDILQIIEVNGDIMVLEIIGELSNWAVKIVLVVCVEKIIKNKIDDSKNAEEKIFKRNKNKI